MEPLIKTKILSQMKLWRYIPNPVMAPETMVLPMTSGNEDTRG